MRDTEQSSTALFLRPFLQPDLTIRQLTMVARVVRQFGRLIAIRNGSEGKGGISGWRIRRLGVKLVDASDDTWQAHAIDHIRRSDAVIVHLAPRSMSRVDVPVAPSRTAHRTDFDLLRERVHESGSGRGVLLELEYCRRANAIPKLLVLIPERFKGRITEVLRAAALQQPGTWWRRRDGGIEALTPRVSVLDEAIEILNDAREVIPYMRFGDRAFRARLGAALADLMSSDRAHADTPEVLIGVPSEPVPMPPDGELKFVRFTPIQNVVRIPRGKVVELSFDEVLTIHPDIGGEPIECPRCGSAPQAMFWYQYSSELVPDISGNTSVYMRCQHCGHDDYL